MKCLYNVCSPTTFTAIINGSFLLIPGILFAIDIFGTDFGDRICPDALQPLPTGYLIASGVWFLYALLSSACFATSCRSRDRFEPTAFVLGETDEDGVFKRPVGYIMIALLTSVTISAVSILASEGLDRCDTKLNIWPATLCFIYIIPPFILTSFLFLLTRHMKFCCCDIKSMRYWFNNYITAIPMLLLWFFVPFWPSRLRQAFDAAQAQQQLSSEHYSGPYGSHIQSLPPPQSQQYYQQPQPHQQKEQQPPQYQSQYYQQPQQYPHEQAYQQYQPQQQFQPQQQQQFQPQQQQQLFPHHQQSSSSYGSVNNGSY